MHTSARSLPTPLHPLMPCQVVSHSLNLAYVGLRLKQNNAGRVAACQLPAGDVLPGRIKARSAPRLFVSPSGGCVGLAMEWV